MGRQLTTVALLVVAAGGVVAASGCEKPRGEDVVGHRDHYSCPATSRAIVVDGVLDDAWRDAEVVCKFSVPPTHVKPRRETVVRITWDRRHLYVGFDAMDDDILAVHAERDSDTYRDDVVEIFFKTDPDGAAYYNFEINPLGTLRDEYHPVDENGKKQWLKGWNCDGAAIGVAVAGTLNNWRDTDERWRVELAIPFASLPTLEGRAPEPGDEWRFHLSRIERSVRSRRGREMTSCAPLANTNFHDASKWLPLRFQETATDEPGTEGER